MSSDKVFQPVGDFLVDFLANEGKMQPIIQALARLHGKTTSLPVHSPLPKAQAEVHARVIRMTLEGLLALGYIRQPVENPLPSRFRMVLMHVQSGAIGPDECVLLLSSIVAVYEDSWRIFHLHGDEASGRRLHIYQILAATPLKEARWNMVKEIVTLYLKQEGKALQALQSE